MTLQELKAYLLSKTESREDLPFGPDVLVFKVVNKIFALVSWEKTPMAISLKCDPERAMGLRIMFNGVTPGYHLNKDHWNTIVLDGSVPEPFLKDMIDESYRLVVKGLKKADKERLSGE